MSTLGKVLGFLNILAAVAFFCLAAYLWNARNLWQYEVFRAELAIHGLPLVDDDPWPIPQTVTVANLQDEDTRNTVGKLFVGVAEADEVVYTQKQEVQRVRDKLVAEVQALPQAQQRDRLKQLLLPLARTGDERDALAARVDDPNEAPATLIDELKHRCELALYLSNHELRQWLTEQLDRLAKLDDDRRPAARQALLDELVRYDLPGMADFQATVVENPDELQQLEGVIRNTLLKKVPANDLPSNRLREPDDLRQRVAHLLYNLSHEPAWHARVAVVVGLEAYNYEADKQAAALDEMAQRVRSLMNADRLAFETRYRQVLQRRNVFLARQVKLLEIAVKDQQKLREQHEQLVRSREAEIEEFKQRTDKLKEAVQAARAKQAEREQELFKEYRELAKTFDRNLQLERLIRARELGR